MVGLSRLAGGGLLPLLLLALLPLALDGKPAPVPQALPEAPAGGTMGSRPLLTEQQKQPQPLAESPGPAAERSDSKTATKGNGCFGHRIDNIGSVSGMGCGGKPKPKPGGS
uniref:NP-Sut-13 n=1 Tax=Suta fasciata TaxID=529716 RepID=R4FKD8_9SAUR